VPSVHDVWPATFAALKSTGVLDAAPNPAA